MSNLSDRRNAPRYPIPHRETVMSIAVTVFIIGILTGLALGGLALSIGVALGGGQVCFSKDGIRCIEERTQS